MPLTPEAITLLRQIKEKILADPASFNMCFFQKKTQCGTTYCIGGWAEKLSGINGWEALGLSFDESGRLFYVEGDEYVDGYVKGDGWPPQFRGPAESEWFMTPQQAADRIEHFIATDGQE